MTQEQLDKIYQEWGNTQGLPAAITDAHGAYRFGAAQFANFILERVELKADEPKEE